MKKHLAVSFVLLFSLVFAVQYFAFASEDVSKVPGQYIVVLKENVTDHGKKIDDIISRNGLRPMYVYNHVIKGFAANIPDARLAQIKMDPSVEFISEDHVVNALQVATAKGAPAPQPAQVNPTGMKRINVLSNANKGTGVGVAVIDTGIDLSHPDLASNIVASKNCVSGKTATDDNGHGTHVAGTIAALNNGIGVVGVAPEAKLAAVKVLNRNGSGTWSSIICGIDWVTANSAAYNIKVANMSLGGAGSSDNNCGKTNLDALHAAICRSRDAGITYVVAAGNESANSSLSVPASYNDAVITVSALADSDGMPGGIGGATSYGADDTFATFSNYGSAVDIGAPGVKIFSTWLKSSYNTISGTSMASPHVAGAAALYLKSHPSATWIDVRNALVAAGEVLNSGHTDPSGRHPEPVLQAQGL